MQILTLEYIYNIVMVELRAKVMCPPWKNPHVIFLQLVDYNQSKIMWIIFEPYNLFEK
jgi:hypothetical protein